MSDARARRGVPPAGDGARAPGGLLPLAPDPPARSEEPEDAALRGVAAELERYAAAAMPEPPSGLAARIVSAVRAEAPRSPVRRLLDAALPPRWPALPGAVADVLRAAVGLGKPVALGVRMEAAALVLVLVVATAVGGTLLAGGAGALLAAITAPGPTPAAPSTVPPRTVGPIPSPEVSSSVAPSLAASPSARPAERSPRATPMAPAPAGLPWATPGAPLGTPNGSRAPAASASPSPSPSPLPSARTSPEPSEPSPTPSGEGQATGASPAESAGH